MSFILDALKKSEKERQREAVPGISDLPVVVHQTRTSMWVIATISGLGLCVVALAWAWWRSTTLQPVAAVSPATQTVGVVRETPSRVQAADPPATRSLATEASRAVAPNPPPAQPAPGISSTVPRSTAATSTPFSAITPGPISITEARAEGVAVPELTLELLVYSDDPARRFVYINSTKYAEGDALAEGPRLVEITPEGALLIYRGQEFLLPQN